MTDVAIDELAALLDAVSEAAAVFELDATLLAMNAADERLFGETLAEARGRRLSAMRATRAAAALAGAFARVAGGAGSEVVNQGSAAGGAYTHRLERVGGRGHLVAREATRPAAGPRQDETESLVALERSLSRRSRSKPRAAGDLAVVTAECARRYPAVESRYRPAPSRRSPSARPPARPLRACALVARGARRPDPAQPDRRQLALERGEVHPARRAHRRARARGRGLGRHHGA